MTIVIGKREGFNKGKDWETHNVSNVFLGTALLSFGWIGFNGGSTLAGTARAAMAAMGNARLTFIMIIFENFLHLVSLLASASSGLTWIFFEYFQKRKLSGLDFCCGAIAGLAAITPGSGFVAPWASLIIGFSSALIANGGCKMKHYLGIDDALDTFAVHGIGGFYGNVITGVFAQKWIGELDGTKIAGGWVEGNWMQVPYQLAGSFAAAVWSFCWTCAIVFTMQKIPGLHLRMNPEEELLGDSNGRRSNDTAEMGEEVMNNYKAPDLEEIDPIWVSKMQEIECNHSVIIGETDRIESFIQMSTCNKNF